jgi:pimeloyl-ACP methyl ester carboxylesterase
MSTITTKDGAQIYYKDWGKGQPIVFSHGWPQIPDDWDGQMLFFGQHGYCVIAHDRRSIGAPTRRGNAKTFRQTTKTSMRVTTRFTNFACASC